MNKSRTLLDQLGKSVLAVVCLLSITVPASSSQTTDQLSATPVKDKWAVVVGISEFKNPAINLKYAAKDAIDFKNFLVNKCNFAADHVKLLTNKDATKDKILDVLGDAWLPRVALPDDLVVIFISSHGSPSEMDIRGVNYVVAHDSNPDKLFTTGLPIQQLASTIKDRVHSNRVLLILDACHSGGAGNGGKGIARVANVDASELAQGTGHMVICSSSKTEASWESKKYSNGIFTHQLIQALQKNGEKTKLADAFNSLKDGVQAEAAAERGVIQTPVLEMSKWKGKDLMLAVRPVSPRPAPALLSTTQENEQVKSADSNRRSNVIGNSSATATSTALNFTPALPAPALELVPLPASGNTTGVTVPTVTNNPASTSLNSNSYTRVQNQPIMNPPVGARPMKPRFRNMQRGISLSKTLNFPAYRPIPQPANPVSPSANLVPPPLGSHSISPTVASNIPSIEGVWAGSNGVQYRIWQNGTSFGWKSPRQREVAVGTIVDDGKEVTCTWSGPRTGVCKAKLQRDANGKVVRMIGDNGISMSRM